MPKLYIAPGACSLGTQIVVRELDLPVEIIKVKLRDPESAIRRINPLGKVPSLVLDDGTLITENSAILPYLADLKPEGGLLASVGSSERAQIQSWVAFAAAEIHAGAFRITNRGAQWLTDESAQEQLKNQGKVLLRKAFEHVDTHLAGREWLVGERFTLADAYVGVFVRWLDRFGDEFKDLANLQRFKAQYLARPSVIAALEFEAN